MSLTLFLPQMNSETQWNYEAEFCCSKIFIYWCNEIVFCLFQCSGLCFSRHFKSSQILQFSCIIYVKVLYDLFKVCIIGSGVHASNWLCFLALSQNQYHQMALLLLSKIQMFPYGSLYSFYLFYSLRCIFRHLFFIAFLPLRLMFGILIFFFLLSFSLI